MSYSGYDNTICYSSSYPYPSPSQQPYSSSGYPRQLASSSYPQQPPSSLPYPLPQSSYSSPTGYYGTASYANHALSSEPMSQSSSNSSSSSSRSGYSAHGYTGSSAPTSPSDGGYQDYNGIEVQYTVAPSSKQAASKPRRQPTTSAPNPLSKDDKPFHCVAQGCDFRTKREYDLKRHMKNHFEPAPEEMFPCPGKKCPRVGERSFKRKDHMWEHVANFHDGYVNGVKVIATKKKGGSGKKD